MGYPRKSIDEGDPEKNNAVITKMIFSPSKRIIDKKLEGSANFHQWKKIVKLSLTGRNQHRHLTESKPRDDVNWDIVDARILGQMLNFMESNIVDLVTHIGTIREMWEYLDVLYSGQNNLSRIYELSHEFYRSERKGRSITQHFADFKRMYEELNVVLPISANVQQMQLQREQLAVMEFLGGKDFPANQNPGTFKCAVCQADQPPADDLTANSRPLFSPASKSCEGPFLCTICQKEKDAMEGKKPSRSFVAS